MYANEILRVASGETMHPGGPQLTRRLLELCDLPFDARILDLGCGAGATVSGLVKAGFEYTLGLDRLEILLSKGQDQHPQAPLACGLGGLLPIANDQLDAILVECSLAAMANFEQVIKEIQRVLRSGGKLAVSDLYARKPEGIPALQALPLSSGLAQVLSHPELINSLQHHGFKTLVWEDHSESLKEMTGQIISTHGSISNFWRQTEPAADTLDIQIAVSKARLGYYILIAQKV